MKAVTQPIITSDKTTNDEITYKSLTLYIDTSYKKEQHARAYGYMVSDFKDLKKGEKVYLHYLSFLNEPQLPPDKWIIHYHMLYCVIRDSQIAMLNNYNLIEIVEEEKKSDIILMDKKISTTRGIVRHTSSDELKDGDEVLFKEIGAFKETIEGKEYYVCETQDMLAKIK